MKREFSAGAVVVRSMAGRQWLAAVRPGGKPEGIWALPKGLIDPGEGAQETALREVAEETGVEGEPVAKLGDVRYVYTWDGERIFKIVSFFLVRYRHGRIDDIPPASPARGDGGPLAPARGGAPPARLQGREGDGGESAYDARGRRLHVKDDTMYALNFYSPMVADQLRSHRKTATIRLGDKSSKYKKGMVVSVLTGVRFGPRERVFDAVIDKVEVKQLQDLSPREIEHDNPEIRRPEEMATFLSQLYNREVTQEDTVTVIRFSQIVTR